MFYGNTILPVVDRFPKTTELYRVMTTKLLEAVQTTDTNNKEGNI
jgi:hypothetical protein